MLDLIETWQEMLAELNSHDRIVVNCAWLGAPASIGDMHYARRTLGAQLPESLLDFYSIANGLQLRWSVASRSECPGDGMPLAPGDIGLACDDACINILPLSQLVARFAGASRVDDELVIGGRHLSTAEVRNRFVPIDFFSSYAFSGLLRVGPRFDDQMVTLTEWGGAMPGQMTLTFREHLGAAFACRGVIAARTAALGGHRASRLPPLPGRWEPDRHLMDELTTSLTQAWLPRPRRTVTLV